LRQGALLLAAWALTNVLFPWNYEDLTDGRQFAVLVLNLRNLAVLALILWAAPEARPLKPESFAGLTAGPTGGMMGGQGRVIGARPRAVRGGRGDA
jgi:hypothetical protein